LWSCVFILVTEHEGTSFKEKLTGVKMGVINEKSFVDFMEEVKNSLQDHDSHMQ